MGGGASKKKSGPNPFAKETKPEQRASADSVDDDDEEVPLPQSKFAGAGDSVFLTTNRKSARRLSDYRDERKTYLCCLKGKNPHEDGKPMQFAQPVEDAAADFDVEAGSQNRS